MRSTKKARLARIGPADFFGLFGQAHERGHGRIDGSLQLGDDGAEARPAPHRSKIVDEPARHALECVVPVGRAHHGANDRRAVHQGGQLGKHLSDPNTRDAGLDRPELPADFRGRLGLDVPQILVRRPASQKDIDDRFVPLARAPLRRLQAIKVRQRQRRSANPQAADPQKVAA